tara:strand:+ start:981 stop:1529 length:549 start_codon:yes stop_codon:yes gene_type:complete
MILIDNFITDSLLLEEIELDKDFFGPNGDFMWWDGWWNSKANTPKKRLIEYIWRYNSPDKAYDISGFEYWTGVYGLDGSNKNLGNHFDKDELHFKNTGEIVKPIVGTIFYPKYTQFDGGYLEIESENKIDRIQPKSNRLVIFDAGNDLHRVTEVTNGTRYAIAINLWKSIPSAVTEGLMVIE